VRDRRGTLLETQAQILKQAPTVTTRDILAVLGQYIRYIDSDDFFRLFLFSNLAVTSAEKTLRVLENVGAMSGVDIRSPYLDRELVEFSTRLPSSFDGGKTYATLKTHMKKAYETTIPTEVLDRKVIGYPSYYWNNGELDEYQHRLFGREHIERTGLFDHAMVNRLVEDEKTEEKKSAGKYAWALTQFSLWYEERFGPEPRLAKAI
jgi:asparagine synthase (glutamine-hydrolysing)